MTLLDTGPLVAYFSPRDQWHDWSRRIMAELPVPFYTCEAVVAETGFLLWRNNVELHGVMDMLRRQAVKLDFHLGEEYQAVDVLMRRYASTPMSLADACLVRMAELRRDSRVLTLDRDFAIYRRWNRSAIPLLSPWA